MIQDLIQEYHNLFKKFLNKVPFIIAGTII